MRKRIEAVSARTSVLATLRWPAPGRPSSGALPDKLRANVSRETFERLEGFAALLREENQRQNLVARSTLDAIWDRHILDSAQLVRFAPRPDSSWLDIGSGAGLPGVVIAILVDGPVTMVEPRKLRVGFLERCIGELGLANASVRCAKVEAMGGTYDLITARAVAPAARLFAMSMHLSHGETKWVLPKGRNAKSELDEARRTWQGAFRLETSLTDPGSSILLATGVRRRSGAGGRR